MLSTLIADAAPQPEGFQWTNLVILLVVALVAWPLYKKLRASISESRRARWAREEEERVRITEETDPDLARNHPQPPRDEHTTDEPTKDDPRRDGLPRDPGTPESR